MVKNTLCNARDTSSIPGLGRSHMEQLNPHATATEPTRLQPVFHNKRSHCNEKSMRNEE